MATPSTPQRYHTTQQAYGRVALYTSPDWDLMVWNGTDDAHSLNIAAAAAGTFVFPSASTGQAGSANTALCGPAFAMVPTGQMGYVAWVNADNKIAIGLARSAPPAQEGGMPTWSLSPDDIWVITASQPDSPPAVTLNGYAAGVLLSVIWQDAGSNCLVQAQVEFMNEAETLGFQPASWAKCGAGAPVLGRAGWDIFAAWTESVAENGSGNMVVYVGPSAGAGSVLPFNMPKPSRVISTGSVPAGANGLGYVPANGTYGFLVSGGPGTVIWGGAGATVDHHWALNDVKGSFGQVTSTTALATVFAKCLHSRGSDGVETRSILAAWPELTTSMPNEVMVTVFQPTVTPIPVS